LLTASAGRQDAIDVNAMARNGTMYREEITALHASIWHGKFEVTRVLLEHGADPFIKDWAGFDAHEVAKVRSPPALALLGSFEAKRRLGASRSAKQNRQRVG
jgi:hypothetical protein